MTEPVRPEDMRISDTERGEVQDRLRQAHDIGPRPVNRRHAFTKKQNGCPAGSRSTRTPS